VTGVLTQPEKPVDWEALDAVRKRAEALGDAMTEVAWRGLFADALKATAGQRAPALEVLSLYGDPNWV
jgi:hypothetical protein